MKIVLFALLVVFTGSVFTDEKGPHGGRIQKVDNFTIEVKRDFSNFYVYLLDDQNKTITSKDMGGEIRFYILDGSTFDMKLKPYNEDGYTLAYEAAKFTSYRITFKLAGKEISAKFENENAMVKKAAPNNPSMRQK